MLSGVLLGFIGSLHCLGMCGPISLALPIHSKPKTQRILGLIMYNSGRLLTYSLLGGIFGLFGTGINLLGFQQWVSILFGVLILAGLIGVSLSHYFEEKFNRSKAMRWLKNAIGKSFRKGFYGVFSAGLLNGLIPCGLVYMAIAISISQPSYWYGMIFMLSFGLGTLPAMVSVNWIPKLFSWKKNIQSQKLIYTFSFIVGILFIYRGIALEIPPLSSLLEQTAFAKITSCF